MLRHLRTIPNHRAHRKEGREREREKGRVGTGVCMMFVSIRFFSLRLFWQLVYGVLLDD